MKYATVSLPDGNYTETKETWLLIDNKEAKIIAEALEDYAKKNKRSKLAQKLSKEMDNTPFL